MDKNKRNWIIAIVVVFILVFGGGYLMTRNNDTEQNNNNGGTVKGQNNVKIVANAASQLTLEDYSTAEFSMKKPQGWKVETGGTGIYWYMAGGMLLMMVAAVAIYRKRYYEYMNK